MKAREREGSARHPPTVKCMVALPSHPTRTPPRRTGTVVIGAGLTGLITALELSRRGVDVCVLDAAEPGGAGATAATSGIASLVQGGRATDIRRDHPARLATAYLDAQRDGIAWLSVFVDEHGVPHRRADAVLTASDAARLEAERTLVLASAVDLAPADDPVATELRAGGQLVLDVPALVDALVAELERRGVPIVAGARVVQVAPVFECTVRWTSPAGASGEVACDAMVVATGAPILERGLYAFKTAPRRIRSLLFEAEPVADILMPLGGPVRSLHTAADGLLVATAPPRRLEEAPTDAAVEAWVRERVPGARRVGVREGVDRVSHDEIPFVGRLPRGTARTWFATGYAGWGLTNAPAAALRIAAEITGEQTPAWVRVIGRRMTVPADIAAGARETAIVARVDSAGWVGAPRTPVRRPAEGQGIVAIRGVQPVAISTVDGVTRGVSAVSAHLGMVVTWRADARVWEAADGSRFAPDGAVLEGPARRPLRPLAEDPAPSPR